MTLAAAIALAFFAGWLFVVLVSAVAVGRFIAAGSAHMPDDAP